MNQGEAHRMTSWIPSLNPGKHEIDFRFRRNGPINSVPIEVYILENKQASRSCG